MFRFHLVPIAKWIDDGFGENVIEDAIFRVQSAAGEDVLQYLVKGI